MLPISAALAAALLAPSAVAADRRLQDPRTAAVGDETWIPFPQTGIRSWHAEDDDRLWVIDHRRRWYRVDLMRPCVGLPYAYSLHFETRGTGRFDRTSAIGHQGQRCPVRSVVRSDAPPAGKEREAGGDATTVDASWASAAGTGNVATSAAAIAMADWLDTVPLSRAYDW